MLLYAHRGNEATVDSAPDDNKPNSRSESLSLLKKSRLVEKKHQANVCLCLCLCFYLISCV